MTPTQTPVAVPVRHFASTLVLTLMSNLSKLFPVWPAVLPSKDDPVIRPLAIGIDKELIARAVVPEGISPEDARLEIRRALRCFTQSYSYLRALRQPGAMRHDIDGYPVEPVIPDHAEYAAMRLPSNKLPAIPTKPKPPANSISSRETASAQEVITVQVPALKITLPLRPDQLHPVDETVKSVELSLDLGDGQPFVVGFSGKNYRKALRQILELQGAGNEVIIIMQGRLIAGHKIEGAGLAVQARTPKGDA